MTLAVVGEQAHVGLAVAAGDDAEDMVSALASMVRARGGRVEREKMREGTVLGEVTTERYLFQEVTFLCRRTLASHAD
jgi:hypothetical protein